jgi:murein DD-endopeptidase MepM/ murein hydrolase activator NlpD
MRTLSNERKKEVLLVFVCLVGAGLACARADIPPSVALSTGNFPSPTVLSTTPVQTIENTPTEEMLVSTPTPFEPEPVVSPTFPATPTVQATADIETILYETLPGDTLHAVAVHFGVVPEDIQSPDALPDVKSLLNPGRLLLIPGRLTNTGPNERLLPDSEVVFSPHATDFDVSDFASQRVGYLNRYNETIGLQRLSGPEVVALVARNNSVNPRLLLALLEYKSGWVTNPEAPVGDEFKYPMGHIEERSPGLYRQLGLVANELGNGYYGWRSGTLSSIALEDGSSVRLAPDLNAASVALQYYFSIDQSASEWEFALSVNGFISTYTDFFGDPWVYQHPLYEEGITQPELILPFLRGQIWAFTGGPHGAWERESAWAALDFAPSAIESGCGISELWAVAAAPGLIVRSENGVVVIDMDGDGREQSGWALLYLHIAEEGRIQVGEYVEAGDLIGHPSCEGGRATGTHIHLTRKYNGEWVLADGPLAFELSGWVAVGGSKPYQGALKKGEEVVLACPCASFETLIQR